MKAEAFLGMALTGAFAVGVLALLAAIIAFSSADWTGTGLSLMASALAFGLLSNAFLRR